MHATLARLAFRAWPFPWGHVRVLAYLNPPKVSSPEVITTLRRYKLKFAYDPNGYIGRFIYYRGLFEEQVLRTMERHFAPDVTFIDIGANIGLHTVVAAKFVRQVYSFEPQEMARTRARKNVELNGLRNVELLPVALGKTPGTARLYNFNSKNDGEATLIPHHTRGKYEEVQVDTLDRVLAGKSIGRCLIKIDVEGGEMDVLLGGAEFIRQHKPVIFLEYVAAHLTRFGTTGDDLIQWLRDAGYTPYGLVNGRWRQLTRPVDCDMMALPTT